MRGMELAKAYYGEYADTLRGQFPQYANRMAFPGPRLRAGLLRVDHKRHSQSDRQ